MQDLRKHVSFMNKLDYVHRNAVRAISPARQPPDDAINPARMMAPSRRVPRRFDQLNRLRWEGRSFKNTPAMMPSVAKRRNIASSAGRQLGATVKSPGHSRPECADNLLTAELRADSRSADFLSTVAASSLRMLRDRKPPH